MGVRFTDTISLLSKSLVWYTNNSDIQYRTAPLHLYDQAAEILTQRTTFAKFLATKLGVNPGRTLEIAAGSGLVSSILSNQLPNVTFIDLSYEALKNLKQRVEPNCSTPKVVNANFLHLPFPTSHFNSMVCVGGYRYVAPNQKEIFWHEMERILLNNGKLIFAQFKPRGFPINGTTLDYNLQDYGIQLINDFEFNSKIELGSFAIGTGSYKLIEYKKNIVT